MQYGLQEGNFDAVITNDDLDEAYQQLKNFVQPEIERTRDFRS